MYEVSDVIKVLQKLAPEELAEDFDNVGFLVGRKDHKVGKILLTLDVDEAVAEEAKELECDMIVSHHPVIFHPVKSLTDSTAYGRMLLSLVENGIAVYSAHTNLDAVRGGLNDFLLEKLGFSSEEVLEIGKEREGIGRVIYRKDGIRLQSLAQKVKEKFALSEVRYSGDPNRMVHSIGICSGGGSGLIDDCIQRECDVYITGDIKYTGARKLAEYGISVIDLGHYESEHICTELFERVLKDAFGNEIVFCHSLANRNVFHAE